MNSVVAPDHVGLVRTLRKRLEHMNQAARDAAMEALRKVASPAPDNHQPTRFASG